MSLLVALELRRRRVELALAIPAGLALRLIDLNLWQALCVEAIVLTAFSVAHALRGPARMRPAMTVLAGLAPTVAACSLFLVAAGVPLLVHVVLLAWSLAVAAGADWASRSLGPGYRAVAVTGALAAVALLAPLLGSPAFPTGANLSLIVSPLVSAGLALGVEVAQAPPLYTMSSIGVVEFRYPPVGLHPVLAMAFAAIVLARSSSLRSRRWA